ncbi:hypothetical protein KY312_02715 [Candidatus Woesearchaeota archaeon]|nr:hypothetical protein [Candidatus Woesearchaeota archaeon]
MRKMRRKNKMSGEDYIHAKAFPEIRYENGNAVLYLLEGSAEEIGRYSPQLVDEAGKQPVIDFSAVDHVNSKTARAVFGLLKEIISSPNSRMLTLRGLTKQKRRAFELVGFDKPVEGSPLENLVVEKAIDLESA